MKKIEIAGGLVVFSLGVVTVFLASRLPIGTIRQTGEGFLPFALGIILMVLALLYVLQVAFSPGNDQAPTDVKPLNLAEVKRVVPFLLTIALATALLSRLGYLLTGFFLMVGLLRLLGTKNWFSTLGYAAATATFSHVLFSYWLKVPLPKGWLGF